MLSGAITQPVFDVDALYRFLDYIERENIRIPIIAGIWPLVSYRNAMFMNNEVPGVVIPEQIIKTDGIRQVLQKMLKKLVLKMR